jgi:hypothetical protein
MGGSVVGTLKGGKQKTSQCAGEGLVQQRLLQRLQRGVLPLVEAGEALGFGVQRLNVLNDGFLNRERWQSYRVRFECFLGHANLTCRS